MVERLEGNLKKYRRETAELISRLFSDPSMRVMCLHGDSDAVGIYEVPDGCVAFPGVETQPLCLQHRISDGSLQDTMIPVVDLSLDGTLARHLGEKFDLTMTQGDSGPELKPS